MQVIYEIAAEILPDIITGNNTILEYEKSWKIKFDFFQNSKNPGSLPNIL